MVAEFESDLIRLRTREEMKVAKAKDHLRGKQPKTIVKKRIWFRNWRPASTQRLIWLTFSAWPVPPSIRQSSQKAATTSTSAGGI